jgi:hypothetical protein
VVTATEVNFPAAISDTKSTAVDSVMANSSAVMMPLDLGTAITLSSVGMDLRRHSAGMVASMRDFLSAAIASQLDAIVVYGKN